MEQSEQRGAFIGREQRPDGSLNYNDVQSSSPAAPKQPGCLEEDPDGINYYPGEALYGRMRSQQRRPAEWKIAMARKALAYYLPWCRHNHNMALVHVHTSAYA